MRRDNRIKNNENSKSILYIGLSVGTIVLLIIIALIFINTNTSQKEEESKLITSKVTDLVSNNNVVENTSKEASSSLGKNVAESEKSLNEQNSVNNTNSSVSNTNTANTTKNENNISNNTVSNNINTNKTEETTTTTENNIEDEKENTKEDKKVEDPIFVKPVEGETLREYAKDKLVYSETLKEWVTHPGIDIKAEKTSVVKAAADGKVISIKNDPRYGLTVVIEHQNNFKTVYSNLLTAEFVTEGEEIKSGQTIGTVGNTAIFEISDEPHLHFEILKDNVNVDPGIYVQQ